MNIKWQAAGENFQIEMLIANILKQVKYCI